MPAPLLIPLAIKACCWLAAIGGTCYCAKKAADAYNKNSKRQKEKLALKGKSMEEARKENERLNSVNRELDDKLRQNEEKEKELEKQIADIKKELDDPNISKKREEELRGQLGLLQTQLDDLRKNSKSYRDEIKKNNEQTKNNSRIISGIASNTDDRHWIWEFLTLENVLIMLAIYALWQIVRDEKKGIK